MFQTDLEMDQEGMTVPYPPLFDDTRKNHGFVDVRGRPDFASIIAEGAGSSAMKALLIALAQPGSKLFTIGCDIGAKRVEGEIPYTAGGYIQIMNSEYARREPDDYARFARAVANALRAEAEGHEWEVQFVLKPVRFKLDNFTDMTGSLWVWFHAFGETEQKAVESREVLIREMGQAFSDDRHVSLLEKSDI
jgi:hypothetical protein